MRKMYNSYYNLCKQINHAIKDYDLDAISTRCIITFGEWLFSHSIIYCHTPFIAFIFIFLKYPQLKVIFNFYLLPLLYLKSYLLIILISIKYKIRKIKNVKDKS